LNFENIQTVVVKRKSDGSKVNISKINEDNRYDEYECIVCGSKMIPAVPGGKTVDGLDAKVTPYFKHLDVKKCGSESFIHFWAKTELIKIGDTFKVVTDKEEEYICNQVLFEKTIIINDRRYTPDATILTSCGNTIHFEYCFSNKKNIKNYLEIWKELNHIIIEVDMNSVSCVFFDSIPTFKALYYNNKCFNLSDEDDFYLRTIGKYKVTKNDEEYLKNKEIEIGKLDYLWEETRKIKYDNKGFEDIGNLIRAISSEESRKIAIDILSKKQCGDSILNKYVLFLKTNIDKHLKLLNLKYNGYLIKYETEVPRLIYDRIFNGVTIKFYIPDSGYNSDVPEVHQTYSYSFKDEILSDTLKSRIDTTVEKLLSTHNLLLKVLDVFQKNDKIVNYKLNYKENTDYINAIYFVDYRNKCFVLSKGYYSKETFQEHHTNVFNNLIDDNTLFIGLHYLSYNFYIQETKDSYDFNFVNSTDKFIQYRFDKFIKQKTLNLSYYFVDKSLPRYNFVKVTSELNDLLDKIEENIKDIKRNFSNTEYSTKIFKVGENIKISDHEIDKKLNQLLYPITYLSNKCDYKELNIQLNKDFTKGLLGDFRLWLIKDFINALNRIGVVEINNIK